MRLLTDEACAQAVSFELSRVMLLAIEVAIELWLALQWSPQAQWLRNSPSGSLRQEACDKRLPLPPYMQSMTGVSCTGRQLRLAKLKRRARLMVPGTFCSVLCMLARHVVQCSIECGPGAVLLIVRRANRSLFCWLGLCTMACQALTASHMPEPSENCWDATS